MSIEEKLRETVVEIVAEQLQVDKKEVTPGKSFIDDLKADSLDIVELVMEFEERFKISIPDEDYDKIKTVGDAIKYIKDKEGKA